MSDSLDSNVPQATNIVTTRRNRRTISLKLRGIFLIALILRVFYAVILQGVGQIHGDEYHYNHFAQELVGLRPADSFKVISITEHNPLQDPWNETWLVERIAHKSVFGMIILALASGSVNAPLMFFWIGIWYFAFGYHPIIYRIVSAIVGSLSIIVLYRLGERLGIDRKGILMACLLLAITPLGFEYSGTFYKEPVLQLLFLCVLYFLVEKRFLLFILSLALMVGFRANLLLFVGVLVGLGSLWNLPILRKVFIRIAVMLFVLGFFVRLPDLMHRSLVTMIPSIQNTAILSKLPTFGNSASGEMLTIAMFAFLGFVQPIPLLYNAGGINYLSVVWNLCAINWGILGPIILSSFLLAFDLRKKKELAFYSVALFILWLVISGYGVAGPESVRYRDTIYPLMLLVVGWAYSLRGRFYRRWIITATFYGVFGLATAYALIRVL